MSLAIDVDKITSVLLPDGWHDVDQRDDGISTFAYDAYEYTWEDGDESLAFGQASGVTHLGWTFREGGQRISGPFTSILAVKHS